MEPDNQNLADWLDEITADPRDSGLLGVIEQLRRDETTPTIRSRGES